MKALLPCLLLLALTVGAGENMIRRQSQNEGIFVLPASGQVVVDGVLDDWDLSGRIWVFADTGVRQRYSTKISAMWDADALYLAIRWRDPTPMYNTVDPDFEPGSGWKSDSVQFRLRTDHVIWATTWFFTPEKRPVLHLSRWKDANNHRKGTDESLFAASAGGTDLGEGAAMAYRPEDDGQGFVQEIRLPWALLYHEVPAVQPGLVMQMGMEFLWGDPTGKTWPVHRYADNMQPGHTSREFFWSAKDAWGNATLVDRNHIEERRYVSDEPRLAGSIPIRLAVPAGAARFTVAVDDAKGRRIRNLAGDFFPEDYAAKDGGVEIGWDGLDDAGSLVPPGDYTVRGLTHRGLEASYAMCFYNPGTPPWRTVDRTGAWMSNHVAPQRVATNSKLTFLSCMFSEGGHALIAVGADGRKVWGELRGLIFIAADDDYVYGINTTPRTTEYRLNRFAAKDGAYRPFHLDGTERPFDLDVAVLAGDGAVPAGIAVRGDDLFLAIADGRVLVLDRESAAVRRTLTVPGVGVLATAPDGRLAGLVNGAPAVVDPQTGATTALAAPGVGAATDLAFDHDGNLLVTDMGPDSVVKAFDAAGDLAYACGVKGGRPRRGRWQPQAMIEVSSIAVDAAGQIWAVENWDYPRRVGVWGRDGKLVRDYIGNTGYAGTGTFLHDQDPNYGYVGPLEFKLDYAKRTWELSRILWVPDEAAGECWWVPTLGHTHPQRFRANVAGKVREYLYCHDVRANCGHVIFMADDDGDWQPVSAICTVVQISGEMDHGWVLRQAPAGEWADLNANDVVFWHDANGDGKPQRAEATVVPTDAPAVLDDTRHRCLPSLPLDNGWGGRIGPDLVFYTGQRGKDTALFRVAPVRITADGIPVYTPESLQRLPVADAGDLVPVVPENRLLLLSGTKTGAFPHLRGIATTDAAIQWEYPNPYPSVHGSHKATMPAPGLLIGPLKIAGVAAVNDTVGRVMCLRGNLGQDYFLTTDGLYVGSLFQDTRLPAEDLPKKEEQLVGRPLSGYTDGGEPFSGWFGRHDDGKIRLTTSMARTACMITEVQGLDSIVRLPLQTIHLDAAAIAAAERDNLSRAAAAEKVDTVTVAHLRQPPAVDGDLRDWHGARAVAIERPRNPHTAKVRLGWDAANLYLGWEVDDESPWRNTGKDFTQLFKTGDAVDLQLNVEPVTGKAKVRNDPNAGDRRLLIAPFEGRPVVVLMRPVDPDAPAAAHVRYHSPVIDKLFDRVEIVAAAQVAVKTRGAGYTVEAAIPLSVLGIAPAAALNLRGDLGIISSDAGGTVNIARTYWSNPHTNLVNDLPHEAWLYPRFWGMLTFGK